MHNPGQNPTRLFPARSMHVYCARDAELAKRFCEAQECPANWKDANGDNCCIHHANIHSCPMAFMGKGGICGPWIPDDGQIFTHTLSTSGQMTQGNWSAKVVLVHAGMTSLIAHIRIGKMQVALEARTLVVPVVVCGNGMCEEEEACATCPADCGECRLPSDMRMSVAIPVAVIIAGLILSAVGFQYQRQRMFWDESWIIKYSDIKQAGNLTGSTLQAASTSNASCITTLSSCTAVVSTSRKQFFTKTVINLIKSDIPFFPNYGLDFFRKPVSVDDCNTYRDHPAQKNIPLETQSVSSAAADMCSYAVILLEIAIRNDPASKDDTSSAEYCCLPLPELIKGKADNACPCPSEYVDLIRRCRSQSPTQRPTFEQVKKLLYKMNPNKVSPVDMMMTLMEKYSKHLELLVAERTQDLMHEKQKTDRLLYSMLPQQVADDLRQGKSSQAQSFSSATVFFSDIVGFTHLSSSSTPYQVVDFLNKLYTTFDDIIDNYGVYKVETIGDAYMVVSGVPKENGIYHASEIASMALDLVAVCQTFRIPHKPNTQLRIRAGIHSGPVVAGVVGTKMPRYCLFGDTVNTASRMESTSEALKIQCTSSAHDLLRQIGGYKLVCRGTLSIKGKGDMTTYWLEGKTGTSTQNIIPDTSAVMREKERQSFDLIPGVLSTDALSTSF
ncbi:atrial natriuretic peptide receptor 2-like [Phyllobates terribilis]|uniref:atrial natriuretic peptide receptor 2-like n=1 Tax=Phyllobates terribilis TaxID=111132 RepID=UPI003CCB715C